MTQSAECPAAATAKTRYWGQGVRGEANTSAKLTEAQVLEIRASNETGKALAMKYGVSGYTISVIRNRKMWRHI